MSSFTLVQDQHNHPLTLFCLGTLSNCVAFHEFLKIVHGPSMFRVEKDLIKTSMNLHGQYSDQDYCHSEIVSLSLSGDDGSEEGDDQVRLIIMWNHRFHDLRSVSSLLSLHSKKYLEANSSLHSELVINQPIPHGTVIIKRQPRKEEIPQFRPVKITKIHIANEELDQQKGTMTINECLFYRTVLKIRDCKEYFNIMCLHNMRKALGLTFSLGDYSCYVRSMKVKSNDNELLKEEIRNYFQNIRNGNYVLKEDSLEFLGDRSERWVYDSWVGSGMTNLMSKFGLEVDYDRLMQYFSIVLNQFIIAVDVNGGLVLNIFSDYL